MLGKDTVFKDTIKFKKYLQFYKKHFLFFKKRADAVPFT